MSCGNCECCAACGDNLGERVDTAEAVVEAWEAYRDAADDDPDVLLMPASGGIPLPPSTKQWRALMDRLNEYRAVRRHGEEP